MTDIPEAEKPWWHWSDRMDMHTKAARRTTGQARKDQITLHHLADMRWDCWIRDEASTPRCQAILKQYQELWNKVYRPDSAGRN